MLILLLVVTLTIILIWGYIENDQDLSSPAVLFTAPFLVATICAMAYSDKWSLNMHINTFLVMASGCLIFSFTCVIIHKSVGNKRKNAACKHYRKDSKPINVSAWRVLSIILLQMFSLFVVIKDMRATVGKYGVSGKLTVVMYWYREWHMFKDRDVSISSLSSNLRLFSIAASYIWIYILCNNIVCEKKGKNSILMLLSIALGMINGVILGARGDAIQIIVATYVMFVVLKRKHNGWKPNIKIEHIILIGIALFGIMYGFKATGNLLGRNSVVQYNSTAIDEAAKYLGAEIKNLDIYLEKPFRNVAPYMRGSQTFGYIMEWINHKANLGWVIEQDLPFQKINSLSLGNVYTVFYPFIYDFGYLGMGILTFVMAALSQLIYETVLIYRKNEIISIAIIINSYVLFLITFSFFGERFFSYILNTSFIKYIVIWEMLTWFVTVEIFKTRKKCFVWN